MLAQKQIVGPKKETAQNRPHIKYPEGPFILNLDAGRNMYWTDCLRLIRQGDCRIIYGIDDNQLV